MWAETTAELAKLILANDLDGFNVYHACATFKSKSRKATQASGAKAFWLDIDVGNNKPFATLERAEAGLNNFVVQACMPPPTIIHSGRGVHAYWFSTEMLEADEWKLGAGALKALCTQYDLRADPVRTADISSILRPPNTYNRKPGFAPTLVRLASFGGIHPRAAFDRLFSGQKRTAKAPTPANKTQLIGLAAAAANVYQEEPADANLIANRCRQIRDLRDLRGVIPEPQWHSAAAVIGRCVDGNKHFHTWSSGDPRYDPAQTDEKLNRVISLSGPTTCAHFASINPTGCAGCPFAGRVTTPLQLGRDRVRSETLLGGDSPHDAIHDGSGDVDRHPAQDVAADRPELPFGFSWGHAGQLQFLGETKTGEPKLITVCHLPIYLQSVSVGELRADRFGLAFRHWLPKEGWREFAVAAKTIGSPMVVAAMLERGITVEQPELFRKYVRDAMNQFYADNKLDTQFEQCGWKDNDTKFLAGTSLYTAEGVKAVATGAEVQERGRQIRAIPGGSLAEWTKHASIFAAAGLEMHLYTVLAAFASPLMKFLSADEGGAVISCVSADSGRGKTTVLDTVSSVWGEVDGIRLVNSDTRIAKSLVFGSLGNLPVVYDEFDAKDPDHVLEFIQTFTTGRDKLRATQDGDLKQQGAKWQTILISASNRSLCDSILSANNTAQTFRILELSMEANDILKARGDQVRTGMKANAGWAGDKYLRYLVTPTVLPQVRTGMDAYRAQIERKPWYKSEMRYWTRLQVAIAFAAVIVERLGLIEFSAERIVRWGEALLERQATASEVNGIASSSSLGRSIDILAAFMLEKRSEILIMPAAWKPHSKMVPVYIPTMRVSGRFNLNDQVAVIERQALHTFVTKDKRFPWKEFMHNLESSKIVIGRPRLVLSAGTDLAGIQVNSVEFDLKHPLTNAIPKPTEVLTSNIIEMRR